MFPMMEILATFLLLFGITSYTCRAMEKNSPYYSGKKNLYRNGRTYDQIFKNDKGVYGDESDANEDFGLKNRNQFQGFSSYKDYPQLGYNKKGESFYQPSVKGGFQFPIDQYQNGMSSISTSNDDQEEGGLLSSLLSEKPLAAAAIIPLSIFMAAVIPGLMSYLTTGFTPQIKPVQTVATNKMEARQFKGNVDNVLEKLIEFSNSTDSEENFQRFLCSVVAGEVPLPGSEYVEMAKTVVSRLVQDDRLNKIDVKYILDYLQGSICNKMFINAETTKNNDD